MPILAPLKAVNARNHPIPIQGNSMTNRATMEPDTAISSSKFKRSNRPPQTSDPQMNPKLEAVNTAEILFRSVWNRSWRSGKVGPYSDELSP